jgi:DNA-binding NarL/FixJ family response regulator
LTRPLRTLIIDDAAGYRVLVREALRRNGSFEVVGEADDGDVGIDEAKRLQPDLVLLDLSMPRMDGLEALPRLLRVAPSASVVVLSGFGSDVAEQTARQRGAAGYLEKGIGALELPTRLLDLLATDEARAQRQRRNLV